MLIRQYTGYITLTRRHILTAPVLSVLSKLKGESVLDVAYAGSMTSVMEGEIKQAAQAELGLVVQGRAQGASGLANLIVSGAIRPDVFISITPSPMGTVLKAGKAAAAFPIARTEMVIAYSPASRFAQRFQSSETPWWQILEEPGLRFGRTDPVTDPQGRNIIFVMQLAAKFYKQPDLAMRVLGPNFNSDQIFTEPSVQARLQGGQLDAASAYKIQPPPFHLPYITLPPEINLGRGAAESYADASLVVAGSTFHPEPLFYYAAALKQAANPQAAARFIEWLRTSSAREIFRRNYYDPPGDAKELGSA